MSLRTRLAVLVLQCALPGAASAQAPQAATQTTPPPALIRVFLNCEGCDPAVKTDVPFVEFVAARDEAAVEVTVTTGTTAGKERTWTLAFAGRGTFTGEDRQLVLTLAETATAAEIRTGLVRLLKFGLAGYAARSEAGSRLDVTFQSEQEAGKEASGQTGVKDPWNYWVFRLSASADQFGEHSQSNAYYGFNGSANRTTEQWKFRTSFWKSANRGRYLISEDETFRSKEGDWTIDSLLVKSLGPHWSAGFTGSVSSSTYSNHELTINFRPAVEFDIFPYSQSSERSFTLQYGIGGTRYDYWELTVYDKLEESMVRHNFTASVGFRQPWGTAGGSADFSQSLTSPEFNRLSLNGSINIRIFRGFTVNGSGNFSRIRDQFYLEKSGATEEEILLRLTQLATGHRYFFNFGFTYSFGSLTNATVNPRFGG